MIKIYYAEDDKEIAGIVKTYLEQQNCDVSIYSTIAVAKAALQHQIPELILVDLNLPDGQGDELCRWIRIRWPELPVMILTVRDDSRDMVSCFQTGADDYVVKPFELAVLYSRISALLRRTGNTAQPYLSCDAILLDRNRMAVYCRETEVRLSQAEYGILLLLMTNKGRTITREQLLEQIWDYHGNYVNDNTLTVTMKRLREKLSRPDCLKTIRSFGYRMEDSV